MTGPSGMAECATDKPTIIGIDAGSAEDTAIVALLDGTGHAINFRIERPSGISARALLDLIEACQPGYAARWLAAADAAAEFFLERVKVATSQDSTNG